jgi:uncharacterized protein
MAVGRIMALWRYPVKSMQGEEINASIVTERGLLGDRGYAILDRETGFVASAKHPRKWGRLLECRAAFAEPPRSGEPLPPVWITLPDGGMIHSAQDDTDLILSRILGRTVSLVAEAPASPTREANRTPVMGASDESGSSAEVIKQEAMALAAPVGTFFDYASLHILTTATINRLKELYPAGRFEARRFRPNIVVAPLANEQGFVENQWLGRQLQIGVEVWLQIIDPCPRCIVTTLPQGDLPRDAGILRTVAQSNSVASATLAPGVVFPAVAGTYANIVRGGTISRGDTARLWPARDTDFEGSDSGGPV